MGFIIANTSNRNNGQTTMKKPPMDKIESSSESIEPNNPQWVDYQGSIQISDCQLEALLQSGTPRFGGFCRTIYHVKPPEHYTDHQQTETTKEPAERKKS